MPRLDWQLWFAALTPRCHPESGNRWTLAFVKRLLDGSEPVLELPAENPFPDPPPRAVRIRAAAYTFSDEPGRVWGVEAARPWCPPLTPESFGPG